MQRSPMIMIVAVPLPKHSEMLGQRAFSQTVLNLSPRNNVLTLRFVVRSIFLASQSGFFIFKLPTAGQIFRSHELPAGGVLKIVESA